jgi:SAM-dependent methyltransferase
MVRFAGQAAIPLASQYERVIGIDASAAQVANAPAVPNIEFQVGTSEATGLPDASADLMTVAQVLRLLVSLRGVYTLGTHIRTRTHTHTIHTRICTHAHALKREHVMILVVLSFAAGLIVVLAVHSQALHWFDLPAFYAEAFRVLKPGGILAVWGAQPFITCGAFPRLLFPRGRLRNVHTEPRRA